MGEPIDGKGPLELGSSPCPFRNSLQLQRTLPAGLICL
jgi:hypothetical protein